jgi:hypothetical protein
MRSEKEILRSKGDLTKSSILEEMNSERSSRESREKSRKFSRKRTSPAGRRATS